MLRFLLLRALTAIPVLGLVALFVFVLLHASPGDPASILAGEFASPDDIAAIRAKLGFDKPVYLQFFIWLSAIAHGDLGTSIFSGLPVTTLLVQRLEPTISLTICTLLLTTLLAVPLGLIAAWRSGKLADQAIMVMSVAGFSIPVFVVGYALVYIFAIRFAIFPSQGFVSIFEDAGGFFSRIVLPTISLSLVFIALVARITRASILEILSEDYIRTAYAKGASEGRVLIRHALRNASVPIITVVGIALTTLIGGVVITETIYNIPGLGRLVVDAILKRDYPVIQALILITSSAYIIVNIVIDIGYAMLDPRIRY